MRLISASHKAMGRDAGKSLYLMPNMLADFPLHSGSMRQTWSTRLIDHAPAELAVRELRRHKFANRIHVIRNGAEALDFIFCRGAYSNRSFTRPTKVILLDVKLPKVDGLQVLAAMVGSQSSAATGVVYEGV